MRPIWLALCGILVAANPLHAWDRENHLAIVDAAFVLSPAAAARIPADFKAAFREEVEEPDSNDRICRDHRGPDAPRHPAVEAEGIFRSLTGPSMITSPYQRARTIGRLVHYVADSAVPNQLAEGGASSIAGYWGNRDYVLFRDRNPLTLPFGASLRERGATAQWADDSPAAGLAAFRLAVNLTIEALLLLPPAAGSAAAPDAGPAGFVVNRIDNGLSARNSQQWYVAETTRVGNNYFHSSYVAETTSGGDGPRKADLLSRRGVNVVEWIQRTEGTTASVRAILFNNSPSASCAITFGTADWSKTVDLTMAADSLERVAFAAPAGLGPEKVRISFSGSGCPKGSESRAGVPAFPRLIVGAFSAPPRFDRGELAAMKPAALGKEPTPPAPSFGSSVNIKSESKAALAAKGDPSLVTWDPAIDRTLAGRLSISSIKVRRQGTTWTFRAAVKNQGDRPLGRVSLHIQVATDVATDPKALWKVVLNTNDLQPQAGGEFDALVVQDASIRPASFKLVEVSGL